MNDAIGYRERRSSRLPATIWSRWCPPGASTVRPDGCMDLIVDGSRIFVAGPDTVPQRHETTEPTTLTAIRFAPGIAPLVLGVPAAQFRDRRVDVADISAAMASGWEEFVATSPTPGNALEALAARAVAHAGGVPGWIPPTVTAVRTGASVADVADRLGLSARQLHRRCVDHFGYGPKMLQRILRVDDAMRSLRAGTALSDTAHRHGYADYAHMFRDFRSVAGAAPTDFRADGVLDDVSAGQADGAHRSIGLPSGSSTTA
ncbi:helix-turn-helix domain-containing protein [Williamsia maris]|uniref:Helix-turn-helix domain-containing protein n=1 Tax=Williamsia maris TaxID=72806 RepID=A0ABT1HGH7_9NOCA|nr:helix-turn-helix domain-containing protein [Williamsia maris]MCP2177289.1 Helix-turn-helix domain-containing protein [Williamsia maris]